MWSSPSWPASLPPTLLGHERPGGSDACDGTRWWRGKTAEAMDAEGVDPMKPSPRALVESGSRPVTTVDGIASQAACCCCGGGGGDGGERGLWPCAASNALRCAIMARIDSSMAASCASSCTSLFSFDPPVPSIGDEYCCCWYAGAGGGGE